MLKSLGLQADMAEEFGACVFDVTLDCEDGAPVGEELAHAELIANVAQSAFAQWRVAKSLGRALAKPRVAVRVHPVDHPAFAQDVQMIVGAVGVDLCHIMVPKVEGLADVEAAISVIDQAMPDGAKDRLPLHVLIESPSAVHRAFDIASHSRVQSLSFGLMDFVSAHGGAIPAQAMTVSSGDEDACDQFTHPLVVRAKLEIAEASHAWAKVPSHCVVTEFRDVAALRCAAGRAARQFGYTRMWSIHPSQIRPILEAFAPSDAEIDAACNIVVAAQLAQWAPISFGGQLHDRASYRYFWQVLERAHHTGRPMPKVAQSWFVATTSV